MEMTDTVRPSLKEKQWRLRQDTILEAASELMISKGYNAMTMDDVANLVGISKATLYQHFSSKHDLAISVACQTADAAYENMSSVEANLSSRERLSALIDQIIEVRYGPQSQPYFEAVGELSEILSDEHPFIQKEKRNTEFVKSAIRSAKTDGALVEGVSEFVAVYILLGAFRCNELEKAIRSGDTSVGEISQSIKAMLLKPG